MRRCITFRATTKRLPSRASASMNSGTSFRIRAKTSLVPERRCSAPISKSLEKALTDLCYSFDNRVQTCVPDHVSLRQDTANPNLPGCFSIVPEHEQSIPAASGVPDLSDTPLLIQDFDVLRAGRDRPSVLLH